MRKISKTVMGFVFGILVAFTLDVAAETLIDSGVVSYSNSKTVETTVDGALDELFSAIDISKQIGSTDISAIGDGTITGAISTLNSNLESIDSTVSELNSEMNDTVTVWVNSETASFSTSGVSLSWTLDLTKYDSSNYRIIGIQTQGYGNSYGGVAWLGRGVTHIGAETTVYGRGWGAGNGVVALGVTLKKLH